ncbi:MAG: hypothetical protein AAF547_00530, partial [Actinomycetota bacterium]
MKNLGVLLAVLVAGTAACSPSTQPNAAEARPEPATVRGEPHGWDRFSIDQAERRLTVHFVGGSEGSLNDPCNTAHEAEAEESADRIVITLYRLRPVDPPEDVMCLAVGYPRQVDIGLQEPLDDRIVVDGYRGVAHRPTTDAPPTQPTITVAADEVMTTTTSRSDPAAVPQLEVWLSSVRYEPWYDGFQFEAGGGVLALDPSVDPPTIPDELQVRTITSRLGQENWDRLLSTLITEFDDLGVLDLRYDPFADTVTVSLSEDAPEDTAAIGGEVRSLLGPPFQD